MSVAEGKSAQVNSPEMMRSIKVVLEHLDAQLSRLPPEYLYRFRRITYQHAKMVTDYEASPGKVPIVLIHTGVHDSSVFAEWEKFTTSTFSMVEISGNTYSMLAPPHVQDLGAAIDHAARTFDEPAP